MQGLASYGSDSEDDDVPAAAPAPAPRPPPPPATTATALQSTAPPPQPKLIDRSPAPPPSLGRVKGVSSRASSPLAGVKLAPPTTSTSGTSPVKQPYHRESSASPPRFERGAPPAPTASTSTATGESSSAGDGVGSTDGPGTKLEALMLSFGAKPLPPNHQDSVNPSVEAKLANFHRLALTRNLHFNDSLSSSKAFRNPKIYSKLVEFVNVDESGTNWDPKVWDPKGLGPQSSVGRIAEKQKQRSEEKAAMPAGARSSIAFASSSSTTTANSSTVDDSARRKDSGRDKERDREREKGRERERERERERGGGGGGEKKRSRWDSGAGSKRERSRSPRRHY